jgi:nitroreductase
MIEALIRERRSIRSFEDRPVDHAVLLELLELATQAPSASNKQPWRFFVVEQGARLERMRQAVAEARAALLQRIPESSREAVEAYGTYFTRFAEAPMVLAPICRPLQILSQLDPSGSSEIARMEDTSATIGTALVLQNLQLLAHARGLGTSLMTGPLLAEPALKEILEVPRGWNLVALMPIGYPREVPPPTGRKAVDHVVRFLP